MIKNIKEHVQEVAALVGRDDPPIDPLGAACQELLAAAAVKSIGEKRHTEALSVFVNTLDPAIIQKVREQTDRVARVKRNYEMHVCDTENFSVQCVINPPSSRIDSDKLTLALAKHGVSEDVARLIFNEATVWNPPGKWYVVAQK